MRKIILMLTLISFFGVQSVFAQTTVNGTVTSADDGGTLPGVSVIIEGTSLGTTTDMDGKFSFNVPDGSTAIVFSFIGMESQTIAFTGQTTINVVLESSSQILDEVLVVAYGTAKKSAFTGSAVQINAESLESRPLTNISKALEGASAGVQVTAGSGQPGAGQDIRIRGFGSYSADNSPLYVVDGVPFAGEISSLNPNDIESLTVLKDAASTALYGNRAANGVVLITTKKGRKGEGQLTLDVSHGFTSRSQREYDLIQADEYYEIMWEAYRNSLLPSMSLAEANQQASDRIAGSNYLRVNPYNVADDQIVLTDGKINPAASLLYPDDLDWMGYILKPGTRDNYDLSYSGGTEKADYFVSLGYMEESGWILESNFKRFSGRANVNFQATDWLKTGFNISMTNSKSDLAQTGGSSSYVNPIRFTRQMGPIYGIHEHDPVTGALILDANGDPVFDINDNRPSGASTGRHVIAEILWDSDLDEVTSLSGKTYATINLTKDLTFTNNIGWDQRIYFNKFFNNRYVGDGAPGGRSYRTFTKTTTLTLNQLLNYTKSFGLHNLNVLVGHESYDLYFDRLTGSMTTQVAEGNIELDNFVNINGVGGRVDTYTLESYLSRVNYDYDGKYYLSASYRRDGSSRFHEDNRWGDFWSLGTSWRMDQEDFIKEIDFIDMLKFRASYGQLGTDRGIGYYAYQALSGLGWNNQTAAGIYQEALPADELVWESNNAFDVALEFGLFNKMFGTLEYYNRASEDLIFQVPLPYSLGFDDKNENIGQLVNSGIEFTLSYEAVKTANLNWNINFNITTLNNEFTRLPQDEIIDGSKKIKVGHGLYDFWLKEWYGVNPENGDALYRADNVDASGVFTIGNDTVTPYQNNARYHYNGSAIPDFMGAITNTLSYKAFEFRAMVTYGIGGKVLDYNYRSIMSSGTYGSSLSPDILGRWQNPGDITDIPRMDVTRTSDFNATSDRWLTDASFIALKQVTVSYDIPENLLGKFGISAARVYFSGENLFFMNARQGMNSQQNFAGTTSNVYTPSQVLTLGLNVKF